MENLTYCGFDIEILQDSDAQNPWADWDCVPPIFVTGDRYNKAYGVDLCLPELSRDQILANVATIKQQTGCRSLLSLIETHDTKYGHIGAVDAVNAALVSYSETLTNSGLMNLVALMYQMQGIPAAVFNRTGYTQGDWFDVLVVATSDFIEKTGAPLDMDLSKSADLYAAYAFGDVYGYSINAGDVGSCWGFYGSDHVESGLIESAKSEIDAHIDWLEKQKQKQVKTWIKNRVPFSHRVFNSSLKGSL